MVSPMSQHPDDDIAVERRHIGEGCVPTVQTDCSFCLGTPPHKSVRESKQTQLLS